MRASIRWIIASLAAVAVVLMAGTQLSDIGRLQFGWRLGVAATAAAVSLAGIVAAIWTASRVFTPIRPLLGELAEAKKAPDSETRLHKRERQERVAAVEQLERYPDAFMPIAKNLSELYEKYRQTLGEGESGDQRARERADAIYQRASEVTEIATYYIVRRRFIEALRALSLFAIIVAAGLTAFAWAANPPDIDESASVSLDPPFAGTLVLSPEGEDVLSRALSEECLDAPVSAMVLGVESNALDIMILPNDVCPAARVLLTAGLGTVVAIAE